MKDVFENNEYEIMKEAWLVYKEFYSPKEDDAYWDRVTLEFSKLMHKFKGNEFCTKLCLFYIDDLDRRAKA